MNTEGDRGRRKSLGPSVASTTMGSEPTLSMVPTNPPHVPSVGLVLLFLSEYWTPTRTEENPESKG